MKECVIVEESLIIERTLKTYGAGNFPSVKRRQVKEMVE